MEILHEAPYTVRLPEGSVQVYERFLSDSSSLLTVRLLCGQVAQSWITTRWFGIKVHFRVTFSILEVV